MIVQARDREVLVLLGRFGVLTSEHIKHLVFPTVSVRFTNHRLALLVRHGFASRDYVPDLENGNIVRSRRPLYSLTRKGAELVEDGSSALSFFRFSPSRWATVRHNLVAADLLTAVKVASAGAEVSPEPVLREQFRRSQKVGSRFPAAVLPDGAFVMGAPGTGEPQGFCIEVVRAGVKGGNSELKRKMARYVALNRTGFFRDVYGIARLRAVLLLTTSVRRATNLASLGRDLPHGRNLFLATSYGEKPGLAMTFDPATVLQAPLINCEGNTTSFIHT